MFSLAPLLVFLVELSNLLDEIEHDSLMVMFGP